MVVVDDKDRSNETVAEKGTLIPTEEKILNNDSSVDVLAESMKGLAVDPIGNLSKQFDQQVCLGREDIDEERGIIVRGNHKDDEVQLISRRPPGIPVESQYYSTEKEEEDVDTDEEGTIIRGDGKDEVELISRGPPGIPVESQHYSNVNNLVSTIQSSHPGTKRRHNQPVDPQSKGFKPHDVPDITTRAQNQLSGGSLKCAPRHGKATVRELIAVREQREQQQQQQQQMYLMQQIQQSQMTSSVQQQPFMPSDPNQFAFGQQPPQQQPNIINGMNIPPESITISDDDDERLPSFDYEAIFKTLEESEEITGTAGLFSSQYPTEQNSATIQQQQTTEIPQTDLSCVAVRRERNQPSMSDSSTLDPRSPESGYQTSSSAPSSPKSVSSRRSWEEDQKFASSFEEELPADVDEQLQLVDDWIREKQESESKLQQPSCRFASIAQNPPPPPPAPIAPCMTIVPPTTQQAPVQFPVSTCPTGQPGQPVVVSFVGASSGVCIPNKSCQQQSSGKGRPRNNRHITQTPTRPRMLLPKPAPQPAIQIIPTTVTGTHPPTQAPAILAPATNQVTSGGTLQSSSRIMLQQAMPTDKNDTTKFAPIVPKTHQRGDPLMKRSLTDILTDSKLKIRAHRQIVGKPLEDIVKKDADGDTWLHSYIMYLNENQDVMYMIHAIISRLKREHKESNINIKQVINTVNNNYQTPVYLATVMNNQYVLDWLLKAGGDPNIVAISTTPTGTVRKGPLHYAASRGDECLDVLYVLLECRETDLNLKNTDGLSPLHVAVQSHGKPIPNSSNYINSTRVIEALIQKGANLEEVDDKNGKTPIHNLVESQSYDLISAIFNVIPESDLKKHLRKQDFRGNTALHIAAQCPMASIDDHKKVVKLLLEKGADPSMKNAENLTSSQLAYKPHKDELGPLLKPTLGKSMHNMGSPAAYNALSPNSQQTIKPAVKKPPSPATPQTYIVVHTLPATTTQMVTMPGITQPAQSQVPIVTIPQNTVLATQPVNCTIPSGSQTLTYTQIPQQSCHTSTVNSPQMTQVRSPQMAQSPPQVHSPEMSQANHDFTLGSQVGPISPPQLAGTTCINGQPANMYQLSNPVH